MLTQNSNGFGRLIRILCFLITLGLLSIFAMGVVIGFALAPAFGF
jgi:hypothetical protein